MLRSKTYTAKAGLICSLLLVYVATLCGQYRVSIIVNQLPASHQGEPVFIAGNFNGWHPGKAGFQLQPVNEVQQLVMDNTPGGQYQFKFTRGSWDKVECAIAGAGITNRDITVASDTVLYFTIAGWADNFVVEKKHTASDRVRVMSDSFFMPQLNRSRRIWIYLPKDYEHSKKRYPVMYMQDGQNLFDASVAAYGEWGVDEVLDSLIDAGKPACIVVGIEHGNSSRLNEYNPYLFEWKDTANSKIFLPEGDAYLAFLIHTLKPYVDKNYRTQPAKEGTIIAGSSMGGLISCYAAVKHPGVFGKAGVFSPAFWTARPFIGLADSLTTKVGTKFFFYMGDKEGENNVALMRVIAEKIGTNTAAMIYTLTDKQGEHNEYYWNKWFAEFYNWIMADGYNVSTTNAD
ncbi:MAG: hypothetical protein RL172_2107 [Bacteroidota bacterium]